MSSIKNNELRRLEVYYNKKFANNGKMPVFSVLTEQQKLKIKNTLGFSFYSLNCAVNDFWGEIKRLVIK